MTNFNIENYIIKDKIKKEISLEKIKRNHLWAYPGNTFFCNQKCICGGEGHDLNIEEINKYRLHNDIWKDIIINNYEKCLIVEDTHTLINNWIKKDKLIINNIPDKWEFLYLGHKSKTTRKAYVEENDNPIFKKSKIGCSGTYIYAVTIDCVEKMLTHAFPIKSTISKYISYFLIQNKLIEHAYISTINLVI